MNEQNALSQRIKERIAELEAAGQHTQDLALLLEALPEVIRSETIRRKDREALARSRR
jgi:hypothetical protein